MKFKAFNPLEYFEGEQPPDSSDWDDWIKGKEPTFNQNFALYCWWQVGRVMNDFLDWDKSAKHHAKYIGDPVDGEVDELSGKSKLLIQEFNEATSIASLAINSVEHPNEFRIENVIFQEAKGNYRKVVQSYAAYTLLCFDKAITALKNNDAPIASEYFMYANGGMNIISEYQKTFPGEVNSSDVVKPLSVIEISRKGGRARWENDPRNFEKSQVKECWLAWQSHPNSYKSKAEFARDMLDKYEHLKTEKTITDWCRDWEK